jgi:cytochrome P450
VGNRRFQYVAFDRRERNDDESLGNLLNVLADRPDLRQRLRAAPQLLDSAIVEVLRYDSSVQFLMRVAVEDAIFHGQKVSAGGPMIVVMGSANRDAGTFSAADEFQMERVRARHLSFGYGIHFCIGAPLARLEARVAMTALLARTKSISRGADRPRRVQSHLLRGFEALPLRLTH